MKILQVVRNTYTEWAANDISALRFSIIAPKMRFNMQGIAVILAIIMRLNSDFSYCNSFALS